MKTAALTNSPKAAWFMGHLPEFGGNPLRFLEKCAREHGDFVPLRFVNKPVILLNDPADIECVLASNSRNFRKTMGYRTPFMRRLFGDGLLTSEGQFWQRQRKLSQPAFHRERIATYADVIVLFSERMMQGWTNGASRDIHRDMMRLTTEVVTKSLFNSEVPREIENLGEASAAVMKYFTTQWTFWGLISAFLPAPGKKHFEEVMRQLDEFIYGLIRERRASGADAGDLLSMLLLARDEDGSVMSDQQLRDELTTLMVAGLDTTALALSWGFYLLSQNPTAMDRLAAEVKSVLGERRPGLSDLPQLRYTEMVVKETMRLYPPGWILGRECISECTIGGHRIKVGTSLIMSQWLKHRDERFFPEASRFLPERWEREAAKSLPKFAYFPFGGGPRICIGSSFAMMEAMLVLASVSQRHRLIAPLNYEVIPEPSITLQPRGGIHLQLCAS